MTGELSQHRIFGLDIGIASVGWAVIAPNHIVALGVRAFDKAETSDKGESLNLARRGARLARHRLFGGFKYEVQHGIAIDEIPLRAF